MSDGHHGALLDDLVRRRGVVMLVGGSDTGKSTLARDLLASAIAAGKTAAYIDADIDQTTVGPPTCIGLRFVRDQGISLRSRMPIWSGSSEPSHPTASSCNRWWRPRLWSMPPATASTSS